MRICMGIALFIGIVILSIVPASNGAVIIVDDDDASHLWSDHTTIQDAVNASGPGDTIRVYAGEYDESVIVNETVAMIGNGTVGDNVTYVNGTGDVFKIEVDDVSIQYMNITTPDFGIYALNVDGLSISNNSIDGEDRGIYTNLCDDMTINNNTLSMGYSSYGIYLQGGSGGLVSGNHLDNLNEAILVRQHNATIENNTLVNGYRAITIWDTWGAKVHSNVIKRFNTGISAWSTEGDEISGNEIRGSSNDGIGTSNAANLTFQDNEMYGCSIKLAGSSAEHYDSHDLTDNTVNGEAVLYMTNNDSQTVSGTWGEVILASCSDITLDNLSIGDSTRGVVIGFCTNVTLESHHAWECYAGIEVSHSSYIYFYDLEIEDNSYAIMLHDVSWGTIERMNSDDDSWVLKTYSGTNNFTIVNSTIIYSSYAISPSGATRDFTIDNITITDTNRGLDLGSCNNFTISNCVIKGGSYGVYTNYCNDIIVENLTTSVSQYGAYIINSDAVTLHNNTFSQSNYGIYADKCSNYTFSNNTIIDPYNCIETTDGWDGLIVGNNISGAQGSSAYYGIYLDGEGFCELINNSIYGSGGRGVHASDSHNLSIAFNEIFGNDGYGIELQGCTDITVHHNNLANNGGTSSQGSDNTGNNTWNDGIDEGNYWDDWGGSGTYSIDGGAGAEDRYPLADPVDTDAPEKVPEFGPLFTLSMVLILAVVFRRRRK